MTDRTDAGANTHRNRRRVLAGLAALTAGGLAGCLGGASGSGDGDGGGASGSPGLGAPYLGVDSREAADAVVMVFEDFRCPHCRTFNATVLPRLREELLGDGGVRFEHHDFPVVDDWSWRVAMAARSVQERAGNGAFWAFADRAFERQPEMDSYDAIGDVAGETGADAEAVVEDAREGRHRPIVEADRAAGREMDVGGTPTVFVDGEAVASSYDAIAAAVRSAQ
jgi:protein-disulfide isomerase